MDWLASDSIALIMISRVLRGFARRKLDITKSMIFGTMRGREFYLTHYDPQRVERGKYPPPTRGKEK